MQIIRCVKNKIKTRGGKIKGYIRAYGGIVKNETFLERDYALYVIQHVMENVKPGFHVLKTVKCIRFAADAQLNLHCFNNDPTILSDESPPYVSCFLFDFFNLYCF